MWVCEKYQGSSLGFLPHFSMLRLPPHPRQRAESPRPHQSGNNSGHQRWKTMDNSCGTMMNDVALFDWEDAFSEFPSSFLNLFRGKRHCQRKLLDKSGPLHKHNPIKSYQIEIQHSMLHLAIKSSSLQTMQFLGMKHVGTCWNSVPMNFILHKRLPDFV